MREVFRLAKEKSEKVQSYNKGKYDGKVREVGIAEGDHVLVKNLREKGGTGKLRSYWEHQIFEVISQQGDLPVYQVRSVDKPRDVRVLHRNHLMKCDELPLNVFKEIEDLEKKKPERKAKKEQKTPAAGGKPKVSEDLEDKPVTNEESDEDFEMQLEVEYEGRKEDTILAPEPASEIEEVNGDVVEEETSVVNPPAAHDLPTIEELDQETEGSVGGGETSVVNPPTTHDLPTIEELDEEAGESGEGEEESSGDSEDEKEIPLRRTSREPKARKIHDIPGIRQTILLIFQLTDSS